MREHLYIGRIVKIDLGVDCLRLLSDNYNIKQNLMQAYNGVFPASYMTIMDYTCKLISVINW